MTSSPEPFMACVRNTPPSRRHLQPHSRSPCSSLHTNKHGSLATSPLDAFRAHEVQELEDGQPLRSLLACADGLDTRKPS